MARRSRRYGCLGLLVVFVVLIAAATAYGLRYHALASEGETEVTLSPNQAGVPYCGVADEDRTLDLYLPAGVAGGTSPALVYVHGGGFTGGDKAKGSGLAEIPALAARGYVVASANYRLAPEHLFPAPIEDVKCAVRYLRANAETLGVDPSRIGIWGGSAGGNLALLAGLTDDGDFAAGEHLEQSSGVAAVVDMFGPTDLTASDFSVLQRFLLGRAFGTTDPGRPAARQGIARDLREGGRAADPDRARRGRRRRAAVAVEGDVRASASGGCAGDPGHGRQCQPQLRADRRPDQPNAPGSHSDRGGLLRHALAALGPRPGIRPAVHPGVRLERSELRRVERQHVRHGAILRDVARAGHTDED